MTRARVDTQHVYDIVIDTLETLVTFLKSAEAAYDDTCPKCQGDGGTPSNGGYNCPRCGGSGLK